MEEGHDRRVQLETRSEGSRRGEFLDELLKRPFLRKNEKLEEDEVCLVFKKSKDFSKQRNELSTSSTRSRKSSSSPPPSPSFLSLPTSNTPCSPLPMSSSSSSEETTHHLRLLRDTLKQPIPTSQTLHSLLVQPLDLLSFLPSSSSSEGWPGPRGSEPKEILLTRFMGSLQTALLENVVGTWWDVLGDEDEEEEGGASRTLMESWFCPLEPLEQEGWSERKKEDAGRVALSSYGTLVAALSSSSSGGSKPSREGGASSSTSSSVSPAVLSFVFPLLARLSTHYPLSKLYSILFHSDASSNKAKSTVLWESFARTMVSIPGKVMNASDGGRKVDVFSRELEQGVWFAGLTREMELVVKRESERSEPGQFQSALLC